MDTKDRNHGAATRPGKTSLMAMAVPLAIYTALYLAVALAVHVMVPPDAIAAIPPDISLERAAVVEPACPAGADAAPSNAEDSHALAD